MERCSRLKELSGKQAYPEDLKKLAPKVPPVIAQVNEAPQVNAEPQANEVQQANNVPQVNAEPQAIIQPAQEKEEDTPEEIEAKVTEWKKQHEKYDEKDREAAAKAHQEK